MHSNCAEWSHGVKREGSGSEEGGDANAMETLSGLEKSVVNAMYQKCNHCRHFGASMKCKSSGKFYHFPCGAASGSYMQKSPQLFIGHDSLNQVGSLGKKMYSHGKIILLKLFVPICS